MNKQVNLVRYADDFIITGISKEILETEVKPLVTSFLRERGLELSEEKTKITHIEEGFDFLGQHVRKYNGQFLTCPSKKNVKAFLTDIRKVIKENKSAYGILVDRHTQSQNTGMGKLSPTRSSQEKTFVHADTAIFKALWRWARRRHPKKGKQWVKDRYFGRAGTRTGASSGMAKGKDGQNIRNLLCLASRNTSNPVHQNQKRMQSLRPGLGTLS